MKVYVFSECSSLLFVIYFLQCFFSSSRMEGTLWYEFSCGLRGFHVYSNIWKPKLNEKINITHERGNMYDPNAMAEVESRSFYPKPIISFVPRAVPEGAASLMTSSE